MISNIHFPTWKLLLNIGKKLSVEYVPDQSQILNLLGKDFKSAIVNIAKELKEIISKELKESMTVMPHQIKNINKETEFFLKSQ